MTVLDLDAQAAGWRDSGLGEVLTEVAQRTADRHRRETAHRTQGALHHDLAKILQDNQIRTAVLVGDDPVDHLDASDRADPAGRALAAGLLGAELHREPRLP